MHKKTQPWLWRLILLFTTSLSALSNTDTRASVQELKAVGHDSRIDLTWTPIKDVSLDGYNIYRSESGESSFVKLNEAPHPYAIYSDFIGENARTFDYQVKCVYKGQEARRGSSISATTRMMTDDELLTSVQAATFRYFWDHAHPVSGLAREHNESKDVCTIGGSGFGLMTLLVGAERGFITRHQAAERTLKTLTFLEEKAERYHGAWAHWLNGETGQTIPFAWKNGIHADDGADIVETSFLIQGMLCSRMYFDQDNPVEQQIRSRVTRLWQEVEWNWFLREPGNKRLYWHWSPNHGWLMNHRIGGHFNECLITYLLALASPTHPIPASCYEEGWIRDPKKYVNGNTYYNIRQPVGWPLGGRLFFTHYSFLGFDPRNKRDAYCNYYANNRASSLIHRSYSIDNPRNHKGYGPNAWGLTSCMTPEGYRGLDPDRYDNGTIAPTAALSAMAYTPTESLAALKHYYYSYGSKLWGEFGFYDAFNLGQDWFADRYLAIDQGPIVIMIENHRTQLCWNLFMANPEIVPMLKSIGWQVDERSRR